MVWFIARICVFCVAVMLLAPSLKIRFDLPDLLVYFIPLNIFLLGTIVLSISVRTYFLDRMVASFVYFLFFIPPFLAFFIGDAQNLTLLMKIALNCGLGALIVLFPWNKRLIHEFLWVLSIFGCILAVNTFLYAGNDVVLELVSEIVRIGYLNVSFAAGMACIASLYLIFTKLSPITLSIFVVNWIGLALSRGRGAFLACAIVTTLYLVIYLLNRSSTQSLKKKIGIVAVFAVSTPIVLNKLLSLSTNQARWYRLLKDFDLEIDEGGRGLLAKQALDKISQYPVLGNGLGEYLMAGGHPHNTFLQFGVDAGILGMIFIACFFATLFIVGIKNFGGLVGAQVNLGYVVVALLFYCFLNLMKSGDSYLGRDLFILSSLPIVLALAIKIHKRVR